MAKRKPEEPPKGSPAWMATFSDLMNLTLFLRIIVLNVDSGCGKV